MSKHVHQTNAEKIKIKDKKVFNLKKKGFNSIQKKVYLILNNSIHILELKPGQVTMENE